MAYSRHNGLSQIRHSVNMEWYSRLSINGLHIFLLFPSVLEAPVESGHVS